MPKNFSVTMLGGNVVADAELRTTSTSKKVANFRVAVNDGYGETKVVDYYNIVAWERLAELAETKAKTGTYVLVTGKHRSRSYEKDGVKHWMSEIYADDIKFASVEEDPLGDLPGF